MTRRELHGLILEGLAQGLSEPGWEPDLDAGVVSCRENDQTFTIMVVLDDLSNETSSTGWVARPGALVISEGIREWRARQVPPYRPNSDVVAGGHLHNLTVPESFPSDLESCIFGVSDVQQATRQLARASVTIAFPYFEMFRNDDALTLMLRKAAPPMFAGVQAIEWLLWKNESSAAREHLATLLAADRRLQSRFWRFVEAHRLKGPRALEQPPSRTIYETETLAWLAHRHDLLPAR